ncbi:MAG: phosphoribosylglycinamide formyltransferase [Rhizobacter sp.]|nr:phosphoribosylglycinamide formyltransferase [Ferruginibacter sp.]
MGQFRFFKKYISKIFSRFGAKKKSDDLPTQVAIFASGAGSNAKKIIDHFSANPRIKISLIVCNKPGAGVLTIAREKGIASLLIEKTLFENSDVYINELRSRNIDWIVLAGFLWKVPATMIKEWPGRIINIHPALLPGYGGKGMYGQRVHEAVIAAAEKESGISIHYVDELYDNGKVIFQANCPVSPEDTTDSLAQKIHSLEHEHFARIIEQEIKKQKAS